jgi:hypothetical protein
LGDFFGRVFLFAAVARLFGFLFYRLKTNSIKTKKQCAVCGSDKKHDGKNYRRAGVGEGQKRQGEF